MTDYERGDEPWDGAAEHAAAMRKAAEAAAKELGFQISPR